MLLCISSGYLLTATSAFSSFPDTSLFTEGSIQFSFKIRDVPPSPASLAFPEPPSPQPDRTGGPVLKHNRGHSLSRERAAEYRVWDERGREWLYGYVWFQQKKDKSISRGYMQVSIGSLGRSGFVGC